VHPQIELLDAGSWRGINDARLEMKEAADASVTEGYIHKIDSALLAAADRIACHIDDAMTGRKTSKVVQLRKA